MFRTVRPAISALAALGLTFGGATYFGGQALGASKPVAAQAAAHWHVVYRATSSNWNFLNSVAVVSAKNAWAAGTISSGTAPVLHWNGSRWRHVSVPGLAGMTSALVAASARTNVWLTGFDVSGTSEIIKRWDGSSWHDMPVPADGVSSLVVLSPTSVWGRGPGLCVHNELHCHTTMFHWNGHRWVPSTVPTDVVAVSGKRPNNVWVAGEYGGDPTSPPTPGHVVSYRWTGGAWHKVTAMPSPLSFFPATIAVSSARSVWLSAHLAGKSGPGAGYLLHWNGLRWRKITAPARLFTYGPLVPDGRGGAWVGPDAHWTRGTWLNTTPGASLVGQDTPFFNGMAMIPGTTSLWGAGGASSGSAITTSNSLIAAYGRIP